MTAKGKINASKLEAGMRIIVEVLEDGRIRESSRKTGENVRIVKVETKHFRAAKGPYEARGKYVIGTSLGQFEAATIQTMFLAPEDAAGIKRAHVEALALNEEFDAAKAEKDAAESAEQINEWLTKNDIFLIDSSTADCERVAKKYHDAIGRDFTDALREDAARKTPEQGDTIERYRTGQFLRIVEVDAKHVTYHGFGKDLTVGVIDRSAFGILFRIVGSDAWRGRIGRCGNEWHRSAPARERMLCPECPA